MSLRSSIFKMISTALGQNKDSVVSTQMSTFHIFSLTIQNFWEVEHNPHITQTKGKSVLILNSANIINFFRTNQFKTL